MLKFITLPLNYETPFGMGMGGRIFYNSSIHRFGFNQQENDNEIQGIGNHVDFKFRTFNSRICKFISVDPLYKSYPELTTFQFASNTPIWAKELEGSEANYTNEGSNVSNENGSGPQKPVSGPLAPVYATELGYTQYGLLDLEKNSNFDQQEISKFAQWNSNEGSSQGGCLGTATRGCEMLTGTNVGWDNSNGDLVQTGQNAWTLGATLENKGFATEVPTTAGMEANSIIAASGNTNGNSTAFLAGPGMAHHSIIIVYTSTDVKFSIYDQGTGYDVKNASSELIQKKFDHITERSGWSGTKMWQLCKTQKVEKKYPIQ